MAQIENLPLVLTGLGLIASILYYTMTLRNTNKTQMQQLETRQAQLFNSLYQRFSSSDYSKQYLTCMLMKWDDYEDWVKKYPDDCDEALQFYSLCNWYKTMNLLIFDGYVSPEAMARLIAFDFFGFWEKFKPIVEARAQKSMFSGEI